MRRVWLPHTAVLDAEGRLPYTVVLYMGRVWLPHTAVLDAEGMAALQSCFVYGEGMAAAHSCSVRGSMCA